MERQAAGELNNVVVLGANGFVGSHLVDKLAAQQGVRVTAYDRFSRPEAFNAADNVTTVRGDFFDTDAVGSALTGADCLIHCFTNTNPRLSDADPTLDITTLRQSVDIFSRCVDLGVKKVVFISSGGAVYGEPLGDGPSREDDCPNPLSPYGIGKLAIENYLAYFNRISGLDYIVYRLTNPYGPRQEFKNGQGVIPLFIDKISRDEQITIFGDGSASRDYIYIEDATQMMADTFQAASKRRVYNLGSGEQTSLNTIVETLGSALDAKPKVEYKPSPATFLQRTDISMERFWEEFGRPQLTTLPEGVRRMLKHK